VLLNYLILWGWQRNSDMGTTIYHPGIGDFKSLWWPDPYSEVMACVCVCVHTHTFVSKKEEIVINFLTQHTLSGKSEEIYWCEFYMQKEMLNHLKFDIWLSHAIILP
jgi:hypothetical protein